MKHEESLGNERILVTTLNNAIPPVMLMNVYLPTQGKKTSLEDYLKHLDMLATYLSLHARVYDIYLVGDFNASISRTKPTRIDKAFAEFVNSNQLIADTIEKPTFIHHSKSKGSSKIDYILQRRNNKSRIMNIGIDDSDVSTSSHLPIVGQLTVTNATTNTRNDGTSEAKSRKKVLQWKKIDDEKYKQKYTECMSFVDNQGTSAFDAIILNAGITKAMQEAAKSAVPTKNIRPNANRKILPRHILRWVTLCRKHRKEWKMATANVEHKYSHPTYENVKHSRAMLRKATRQSAAQKRNSLYEAILQEADDKNFHKLINMQRKAASINIATLRDEEMKETSDVSRQMDILTQHYRSLATPTEKPHYDAEYQNRCRCNNIITAMDAKSSAQLSSIADTAKAIKKLKKGKAADPDGITAEHIVSAGNLVAEDIAVLNNVCISTEFVPAKQVIGKIISIPKKGKDPTVVDNHRGIQITSILGKVTEHISMQVNAEVIKDKQSHMQFGFTEGLSPNMASVIITEAVAYAKHQKRSIFMASLDARKAFDVVDHHILGSSLNIANHDKGFTQAVSRAYSHPKASVQWKGASGHPFGIKQGVRQGGVMSAHLYKVYLDPLLQEMNAHRIGMMIGCCYWGAVACADDVMLIASNEEDLQAQLNMAVRYSKERRYELHPQKSCVIHSRIGKQTTGEHKWTMNGDMMPQVEECTHLGLTRRADCTNSSMIVDRIAQGQRTAAALMGAGFHGSNGVGAKTASRIYHTYVCPVYLYGLDSIVILQRDLDKIERFHMNLVKQIQGLPERTSNSAALLMLNMLPIEAMMDKARLSLLGSICTSRHAEVATTILHMLNTGAKESWSVTTAKTLVKYGLPDITTILLNQESKMSWKKQYKDRIAKYWYDILCEDVLQKKSLKWMRIPRLGRLHSVWNHQNNTRAVREATIKARLMTGTYLLQSHKKRFNQFEVSALCPLCQAEDEDTVHFIARCSSTEHIRARHNARLRETLMKSNNPQLLPSCDEALTQMMVDHTVLTDDADDELSERVEVIGRNCCYDLHLFRHRRLNRDL